MLGLDGNPRANIGVSIEMIGKAAHKPVLDTLCQLIIVFLLLFFLFLLQTEGQTIIYSRLRSAYLLCTSSSVLLLESGYSGPCRVDRGLCLRKLLVQIREL